MLGALSSGLLLYGISLLYGAAGTVQLDELARALPAARESVLVSVGWLLLASGLLFKVAAVPFHVWTPDVYVGASFATTPVPLRAPALVGVIAFCAAATLVLGVFPGPFIELAKAAALPLPP